MTYSNQNSRKAKNFEEEWEFMRKDMAEIGVPEGAKKELKRQLIEYYKGFYERTEFSKKSQIWGNWRPDNAEL